MTHLRRDSNAKNSVTYHTVLSCKIKGINIELKSYIYNHTSLVKSLVLKNLWNAKKLNYVTGDY